MTNLPAFLCCDIYFIQFLRRTIWHRYIDTFWSLPSLYRIILILAFGSVTVIECLRLYIGYKGNLRERVSELAGFWLVTVLLQTPLQAFLLLSSGLQPSLLERIVQSIMCIFLLSQLIFGIMALRNSAKNSVMTFHLSNSQYQRSQEDGKPS